MIPRILLLVFVLAQLGGCSSGHKRDRTPTTDQPGWVPTVVPGDDAGHFEGIWQGVITPDDTGTSSGAIVIVNGWGEFRLLSGDTQFVGGPQRSGADFGGDMVGIRSPGATWGDGSRVSAFEITGQIGDDGFIDATYSGESASGSLGLSRVLDSGSRHISSILGTWVMLDDNENVIASFQARGMNSLEAAVSGTQVNGCVFSGAAESWTSAASYDIWEFSVSECPAINGVDVNGEYSGSAAIFDVAEDGRDAAALVMGLSNDENQLTFILYR